MIAYFPSNVTHIQQIDCSTWTTKMVDNMKIGSQRILTTGRIAEGLIFHGGKVDVTPTSREQ